MVLQVRHDTGLTHTYSYFQVIIEGQRSEFINLPFSVPQGSSGGSTYYSAYASTLQECIPDDLELDLHGFTDNHAYKKLFDANSRYQEYKTMGDLSHCASEIKTWMDHNRLKMNDSKTEFILFGSRKQLAKCITTELEINGNSIPRSECICYLGEWMDKHLSFKTHIQIKCKSATFNLFRLCKICSVLTRVTANLLALALIISHLDYANATLNGLPDCDINEMQRIQNMGAKMVLSAPKYSSPMECMIELHWLPIQFRIQHRILTLVYKTLHGNAPDYMKSMLREHIPSRSGLRAEQLYKVLGIPHTQRKTFAT